MFDRFEDEATAAMNEARKEAQRFNHAQLQPEHMLLAVLSKPVGNAAQVLQGLGVDPEAWRSRILEKLTPEPPRPAGPMPFTHLAKKLLEFSMESAGRLDAKAIGTQHFLLGAALLAEREGWELGRPPGVEQDRLLGAVRQFVSKEGPPRPRPEQPVGGLGGVTEKLLRAATLCDEAKIELIRDQKFELAARARDIGYWLCELAKESGPKSAK